MGQMQKMKQLKETNAPLSLPRQHAGMFVDTIYRSVVSDDHMNTVIIILHNFEEAPQLLKQKISLVEPLPLLNINSTYYLIGNDFYWINITWNLPEHLPDYYKVVLNSYSKGAQLSQNVSGVSFGRIIVQIVLISGKMSFV